MYTHTLCHSSFSRSLLHTLTVGYLPFSHTHTHTHFSAQTQELHIRVRSCFLYKCLTRIYFSVRLFVCTFHSLSPALFLLFHSLCLSPFLSSLRSLLLLSVSPPLSLFLCLLPLTFPLKKRLQLISISVYHTHSTSASCLLLLS